MSLNSKQKYQKHLNTIKIDAWKCISKGMFAIGWLELGESDRAQLLLEKCFENIQGPFQVPEQSSDNTVGIGSLYANRTSSYRCGANHRTALGRSTSSLEWGDSCRRCCLVTRVSGQPQWKSAGQTSVKQLIFFCSVSVAEFRGSV